MKNLLLITMLLGVGYSQCNESNWQEYYPDMAGCDLTWANLSGANLSGANLCNLTGSPSGDACEQPEGITDENGDGYDDVSYDAGAASVDITTDNQASFDEGYNLGAQSGDANLDGTLDVLDMVMFIDIILNP